MKIRKIPKYTQSLNTLISIFTINANFRNCYVGGISNARVFNCGIINSNSRALARFAYREYKASLRTK